MAEEYHLSFSIGPVQGFVSQARRTRDLWAGSWLLSYLAESALAAAEQAGGTAIIPFRSDTERGKVTAKDSPIGGMPNRFELVFAGPDAKPQAVRAAEAAQAAFQDAWNDVAKAVFNKFLTDDVRHRGDDTERIWRRQIGNFWERQWVIGQPGDGERTIGRLAATRKHFRNVAAIEEPGVKCSLMPALQELSGHRAGTRQKEFWHALRQQVGGLDIGDSERLCAIALIKRLFPKVIKQAVGEDVSPELAQVAWPSTAFMAAIPWLNELTGEALETAKRYQQLLLSPDAGYEQSEWQAARDAGIGWAVADGPIWYASAMRNDEPGGGKLGLQPSKEEKQVRQKQVRELLDELGSVYRTAAGDSAGDEQRRPVPYYALLMMDGDSMGALLQQLGSAQELSKSLGQFSKGVDGIVRKHFGRTVYAGGDDVLAIVPADSALLAADELRARYANAFREVPSNVATISASVVYAHWRYPLRQVLHTAHHLLDDVAKDRTGRDSLAIGVILGSGLNAVWSVPWSIFHGTAQTERNDLSSPLLSVLDRFEQRETEDSSDPPFNATFLYLLRERFGHLLGEGHEQPGEFLRFATSGNGAASETSNLLRDLAHAEYRRRLKKSVRTERQEEQTKPIIDELMALSRPWRREQTGGGADRETKITCDRNAFSFDGWRVARFLKQIKDGKVDDHD
ncbi:MAG: type III-B CRISPR-associated protein Cas10/Cmr2 [Candidatus Paceibacterota bacterium]